LKCADASLVAVRVRDDGGCRRSAVVDDDGPCCHCGGDTLLGDVVRELHVDVEPLAGSRVRLGLPEPEDRHPVRGVAHVVTDGAATLRGG
jgi:hypothetical protein